MEHGFSCGFDAKPVNTGPGPEENGKCAPAGMYTYFLQVPICTLSRIQLLNTSRERPAPGKITEFGQ